EARPPRLRRGALRLGRRAAGTGPAQERVGLVSRAAGGDVEGGGRGPEAERQPASERRIRLAGGDRRARELAVGGVGEGALGGVRPAVGRPARAERSARVRHHVVALEGTARQAVEGGRQREGGDRAVGDRALVRADRRVVEAALIAVVAAPRADREVDARLAEARDQAVDGTPQGLAARGRAAEQRVHEREIVWVARGAGREE